MKFNVHHEDTKSTKFKNFILRIPFVTSVV